MGVVGNGDIASILPERDDLLFFASGVSNSGETRESEFERERKLLLEQPKDIHVVYFSSLGVLNGDNRYLKHKREMEGWVKTFNIYTIIRIGNIDFGKNPHTLINHLRNKISTGEDFAIQDVYRYVVGEEELLYWIGQIPPWSCEMNVPGRRLKVAEIVSEIIKGEL